jgi:hypothetical protein
MRPHLAQLISCLREPWPVHRELCADTPESIGAATHNDGEPAVGREHVNC